MNETDDGHNFDNIYPAEPETLSSFRNELQPNLHTDTIPLNNKPSSSTLISYSEILPPESASQATIYDDQVSEGPSEFEKAGIFNRFHFIWGIRQIWRLQKKNPDEPLKLEDFNLLGKSEEVSHKILAFEKLFWDHRRRHNRSSLVMPIIKLFWQRMIVIQIFVTILQGSKLLNTFVLRELLHQIKESNQTQVYFWGFVLVFLIIASIHGNHTNYFYGNRMAGQLKPTLTGMIYRKISRLNFYSINRVSIGKIVNIASNDLNSFENNLPMVFYLLVSPFLTVISLSFLWEEFGVSAIPGIILILATWPYQVFLSKIANKHTSQKNNATDERIKLTNEMVEGIRLLKMYSWDVHFSKLIGNAREKELDSVKVIKYTEQLASHFLAKVTPSIGSFVIFLIYVLAGNSLTVEKVYSAITLMTFLGCSIMPQTCYALRFLVEARLTFQRIIQILDLEEFDPTAQQSHSEPVETGNAVEFSHFSAFWGEKQESADNESRNRGNLVHDGV